MVPTHLFELMIAMFMAIIALHYLAQRLGLPPLLLDGAWSIPLTRLRRHLVGIASLAVGALLFTCVIVALITHLVFPSLPWAACAALGAIVSPPDAVPRARCCSGSSCRGVCRSCSRARACSMTRPAWRCSGLQLPLQSPAGSAPRPPSAIFFLAIGGVLIGVAVGTASVVLARRLGDEYPVIAASTMLCWTSYLLGEYVHVSGVFATVTTGLIAGWNQSTVLSAATRGPGIERARGLPRRRLHPGHLFAVILVTVLVQGTSLARVIGWARLVEPADEMPHMNLNQAEACLAQAQLAAVQKLAYDDAGKLIHRMLLERYQRRTTAITEYVERIDNMRPLLQAHFDLVLQAVATGRRELIRLHRDGDIDDETLRELEHDLDLEELSAVSAKA